MGDGIDELEEYTRQAEQLVKNKLQKVEKDQPQTHKEFSLNDTSTPAEPVKKHVYKTESGRIRYTTVINENIKKNLQAIAQNKSVSVADIIEVCIVDYFGPDIKK